MRLLPLIKKAIGWMVVALGILAGCFGLAIMAARSIPFGARWIDWLAPIAITFFGLALLTVSVVALRNPKRAGVIALLCSPLVSIFLLAARYLYGPSILVTSSIADVLTWFFFGSLFFIGVFWLGTHKLGWSSLAEGPPRKRVVLTVVTCAVLVLVPTLAISVDLLRPAIGDCGPFTTFGKPSYARQAVFVGRIVHVDPILGAVVLVKENFGGLPSWESKIAFSNYGKVGETWFFDGRRRDGLLTQFLPTVDIHCTNSNFVDHAEDELRVLRDRAPTNGVRIIGHVVERGVLVSGTNVKISGPVGSIVTETDEHGVYDVSGLPAGQYTVEAEGYEKSKREYLHCPEYREPELKSGDVWGCTLGF